VNEMDKIVVVRCLDDSVKITRMLNKGYHITGNIPFIDGYIITLTKYEENKPTQIEEIKVVDLKNPAYNTEIELLKKRGFKIDKHTTATVTMVKLK
jgi:hypothetical protein